MMEEPSAADVAALARSVVDAARYFVLATADAAGRPWATPVWFATADRCTYYWASRPGARHSANLAGRPRFSAVVFDSQAAIGSAAAVYLELTGRLVDDAEQPDAVGVFSGASVADGAGAWRADDFRAPQELRLYRGDVLEAWVLGAREYDVRDPVPLNALRAAPLRQGASS